MPHVDSRLMAVRGKAQREAGERQPGVRCLDCEVLLPTIEWKIEALIEDTLRYLPVVADLLGPRLADQERAQLDNLSHCVATVTWAFDQLRGAANEYRQVCSLLRLGILKNRTQELLKVGQELDLALGVVTGGTNGTRPRA